MMNGKQAIAKGSNLCLYERKCSGFSFALLFFVCAALYFPVCNTLFTCFGLIKMILQNECYCTVEYHQKRICVP